MITKRYEVKKLIISHKGGTVYHYWKDVKMIGKEGMFSVEEIDEQGFLRQSSSYFIFNKKKLNIYDDIINMVDNLTKQKEREIKIKQLGL